MTEDKKMQMLTRKEAAAFLGCSVSYLEKKAFNEPGVIPCVRIGRSTRYKMSDLEAFIESRRH